MQNITSFFHKEGVIGFKILSNADLGQGTSHQTHIGLMEGILTFVSDNACIPESKMLYDGTEYNSTLCLDYITNPDGTLRSPKMRLGSTQEESKYNMVRLIRYLADFFQGTKMGLFWFALNDGTPYFILIRENSATWNIFANNGINLNSLDKKIINISDPEYSNCVQTILDLIKDKNSFVKSGQNNSVCQNAELLSPEWFASKAKDKKYIDVIERTNKERTSFLSEYGPDVLTRIVGKELLLKMFKGPGKGNRYLINELENNTMSFGSGNLGNAHNAGILYKDEHNSWVKKHGSTVDIITEEDAVKYAESIRDILCECINLIKTELPVSSTDDYNRIYKTIKTKFSPVENVVGCEAIWVRKYIQMVIPEFFPIFYNNDWLNYILCTIGNEPDDSNIYTKMGQVSLFIAECKINNIAFDAVFCDHFGKPKSVFRIGTGRDDYNYFEEWKTNNYVAMGWNELDNIVEKFIDEKKNINKNKMIEEMIPLYDYDRKTASRKAGELIDFISSTNNETYVVAMNGRKVLGIGLITSDYYYDPSLDYGNCRDVKWLCFCPDGTQLPEPDEGKLTTYHSIDDYKNIKFVYHLVNYTEEDTHVVDSEIIADALGEIKFETGFESSEPRNLIYFGAPGTGKSYSLNKQMKELLKDNADGYERVTFHPDYTYANFVGTYKPVPCKVDGKDSITYSYVPGPFMRTLVNALESGRKNNPKPFVLLVEEINRANVAAVFGDVFQLLDRNERNASEYPIQASEDMKKHLSDKLGGQPEDFKKIRIPDNMFIWATMNSADQGVFPMDTAFKRRWDFRYLGIDESENDIIGKTVQLCANQNIEWNRLRKSINRFLADNNINEDKQLGPYFIARRIVVPETGNEIDADVFRNVFKNKVIMYLYEDAAKQKRDKIFRTKKRYSEICAEFDKVGIRIFNDEIVKNTITEEIEESVTEGDISEA